MTRHHVIFDCDPGVDDAISLLVAMASPDELDILAITTVAGNVPLDVITRNALSLTELARRPEIAV
ncbi:MAG: nucleoside hydrolase, partial [Alphaproteobacteria bacterium]|nr:nucleoside hydrolase [Alphaproteobacteria bacterium]